MNINLLRDHETENLKLSISEKIATIIVSVEYFLCYNNFDGLHASGLSHPERFRWLDINASYFGDTPEIFFTIMVAGYIASHTDTNTNAILKKIKLFLPDISATLIATYYTLGETLLPALLPGTPDIKDVPAVLITSAVSPIMAKYIQRNRKRLAEVFLKLH